MINCCIEKKRHREGLFSKVDQRKKEIDKTSEIDNDEVLNVSVYMILRDIKDDS